MVRANVAAQDDFIGTIVGTAPSRLDIHRHGRGTMAAFLTSLAASSVQLQLLYENGGRENFGNIDVRDGLKDLAISSGSLLPMDVPDWVIKPEASDPTPDLAADVADSSWKTVDINGRANQVPKQTTAVFRTHIDVTADDLAAGARTLVFGAIPGEHRVFLDGRPISGKTAPPRYDLTNLLHTGRNTVAVVVTAGTRSAGIGGGAELDPAKPLDHLPVHWQISTQSTGLADNWQNPDLDDSKWETVKLSDIAKADPPASEPVPANLVWYRLKFVLPAADPHVWVPWKLHLEASGNGFIYLNGHNLGRWWEIGPQKDFFLPDCWLNFGGRNVIALCMRPTKSSPTVKVASVLPYSDFVEWR